MEDWFLADIEEVLRRLDRQGFLRALHALDTDRPAPPTNSSAPPYAAGATRPKVVTVSASKQHTLGYLYHIPHFSQAYFNYFSLALLNNDWAHVYSHNYSSANISSLSSSSSSSAPAKTSKAASTGAAKPPTPAPADRLQPYFDRLVFVHSLLVSRASKFWDRELASPWIEDLVSTANTYLGHSTIRSDGCDDSAATLLPGELNYWFLHPSDALLLGSLVLGEDPCKLRGSHSRPPRKEIVLTVGFLRRGRDRRIINAQQLLAQKILFTASDGANVIVKFVETHFEGASLYRQAQFMRSLDVLVTGHGAGETNIAWMPPCSAVIEYFPHGYYIPYYFRSLAEQSGVLHEAVLVSANLTVRADLFLTRKHCRAALATKEAEARSLGLAFADVCNNNKMCRFCARSADGVVVPPADLRALLQRVVERRAQCALSHPFLSAGVQR